MPHTALKAAPDSVRGPVFAGLRTGLHILFVVLVVLVAGRAIFAPSGHVALKLILSVLLLVVYGAGGLIAQFRRRRPPALIWLATLTCLWCALIWLTPDAAYLIFPMFFLYLHILGGSYGATAIITTTLISIYALGAHNGWSVGGVIGPLVGAGVALLIGLGYQALAQEARRREALMAELLATRSQLAASEHESGILAERARLAREIHDTVAQGLSSIQMLLHAAELRNPDGPGIEHIRLARATASENLGEARRFIRELTPPALDQGDLGAALRRLATTQWDSHGFAVQVRVAEGLELPMHVQTALLRISQGAVANVIQHAQAIIVTINLARQDDHIRFSITDDGRGFDPTTVRTGAAGGRDSFGLRATLERVEHLGGHFHIDSAPGKGTTLTIDLHVKETL